MSQIINLVTSPHIIPFRRPDYLWQSLLYRKLTNVLFVIVFFVALPYLLHAQPSLQEDLIKPDDLFIGTPFELKITIIAESGLEVNYPEKDTVGVFSIIDIRQDPVPAQRRGRRTADIDPEKQTVVLSYILASFETGEQTLSPLRFEIFDPDKQDTQLLQTSTYQLNIQSILPDSVDTIKDIAPPVRVSLTFWDYIIPLLIIIVIIVLIIVIIRKINRPVPQQLPELKEDPRPAYLKALELLHNLQKEKLLEKGQFIDYYYHLSLILRIFLELHYKFKAVEMTTSEIKNYIMMTFSVEKTEHLSDNISAKPKFRSYEEIINLLDYSDLIKFAKHKPDVKRSLGYMDWLEKYLRSFAVGGAESDNGKEV